MASDDRRWLRLVESGYTILDLSYTRILNSDKLLNHMCFMRSIVRVGLSMVQRDVLSCCRMTVIATTSFGNQRNATTRVQLRASGVGGRKCSHSTDRSASCDNQCSSRLLAPIAGLEKRRVGAVAPQMRAMLP